MYSNGRGVLIAVHISFSIVPVDLSVIHNLEGNVDIVGHIITKNTFYFIVVALYIPPDITLSCFQTFVSALQDIQDFYCKPLFIIGDFNTPSFTSCLETQHYDSKSSSMLC